MKNYFQKKINFISLLCVIILSLINIINIIYNTPMIPDQHWAQKIFYVHVPSAWVGFLSYLVVMISGIMYLISNDDDVKARPASTESPATGVSPTEPSLCT